MVTEACVDSLRRVRDLLAARGQRNARLDCALAAIEIAPPAARERIASAMGVTCEALRPIVPVVDPLCPAYPAASRKTQARLALGESPTQILRGLAPREAHAALAAGATDAVTWICRDLPAQFDRPRSVPVARWLVACWGDSARRSALETSRTERGPHGEEVCGRLLDRVDEIAPADLPRGPATGVREAFAAAARRAYARWEQEAERQHELLAPPPAWWRPVRCVRLLQSAAELVAEGREMRHCVGLYAKYVRNRRSVIVSIRVRVGDEVHASTAEIVRNTLVVSQHRARSNGVPHPLCRAALEVCLRRWTAAKGG